MKMKTITTDGCRHEHNNGSLSCTFRPATGVGDSLRSKTSLAIGSWLGYNVRHEFPFRKGHLLFKFVKKYKIKHFSMETYCIGNLLSSTN